MADHIEIKFDNINGFQEAARLAPKRVLAAMRQQAQREGSKFETQYRKQYLFGGSGINLPARAVSYTLKKKKKVLTKIRNKDAVSTQLAHVKTKTVLGRTGLVLVAYLSRFLTYHQAKLAGPFYALFRTIQPKLHTRLEKEAVRITQAVLDKGLRDAKRGGRA